MPLGFPAVTGVERPVAVSGVRCWDAQDAQGHVVPGPAVAIVGRQHGNEPVGADVIERLVAEVATHLQAGSLWTFDANLDAVAEGRRHTAAGVDMNRLWDRATLTRLARGDPGTWVSEERRVAQIAPLLQACDAVLDLHSTSRPSAPHVIYRDDRRHADLVARLGVLRCVTGVHENGVLRGAILGNLGLDPGEPGARIGVTLEAGQHDDPANADAAWQVAVRFLTVLGVWRGVLPPADTSPEVYEILSCVSQRPLGSEPWRFVGYAGEPGGAGSDTARRQLASFERVDADELVLRAASGEVLRAEAPFTMLMPSLVAGPGEDLYFVAQRRQTGTSTGDAHQVAAEASAIERVLDLLAWDEAERGTVRVPLESRRTLDACAELVLRTARLPEGHPHRCLTLVGRGGGREGTGDDPERRRWREAVAAARRAGVPIERFQLLRGATLAGVQGVAAEGGDRVVLRYCDRQPTSIAMVVAGDPALALRTGDARHVDVALRVEAVSIEAAGDDVEVVVSRAGLIGSRPELLGAAVGWIEALRSEDRRFVRELGPHQDRAVAVGDWLVGRWREALATLSPGERANGSLGGWLRATMLQTGVLDAATLRAWCAAPRAEGGWRVVPPKTAAPPASPPRPSPQRWPPPLQASDVTADNLERWVGWRRWVAEIQAVAGRQGRDVEVIVGTEAVQDRVAAWVEAARQEAERRPGSRILAIAGNGHAAPRADQRALIAMATAHERALAEPGLHHLRVQHVRGTRLPWWRGFVDAVVARPSGSAPVGLAWDADHGGSISVLVVGERDPHAPVDARSLEGWTVSRVLLLFGGGDGADRFQVALASSVEGDRGANAQLVHFARVHMGRLARQSSFWMSARPSPLLAPQLQASVQELLAGQARAAHALARKLEAADPERRVAWLAGELGLSDRAWCEALVHGVMSDVEPGAIARDAWGRFSRR